jgi:anti-anti-sigma factor
MQLDVNAQKREASNTIVVSCRGQINSDTYEALDRELSAAVAQPIQSVILDLKEVTFISSAGVGTIVKAKVTLNRKGAELALINLQPQIKKVFEVIRLLPMVQVFQNTAELDEYLARLQRKVMGQEED